MARPGEIELALWIHDVIYDPHGSDSEERSATWGCGLLDRQGVDAAVRDRFGALVLVTKHDASPVDGDQKILLDIDLSILGASRDRFDEYEVQVRREYEWVADEAFAEARARILRAFLKRDRLYHTDYFRDALETRARDNLDRSLRQLD